MPAGNDPRARLLTLELSPAWLGPAFRDYWYAMIDHRVIALLKQRPDTTPRVRYTPHPYYRHDQLERAVELLLARRPTPALRGLRLQIPAGRLD